MDEELRAIREARLRELKQQGSGSAPGASAQDNGQTQAILSQILTSGAQERLSRVALVRPERVKAVESYLMQAVRSGAIRTKLTDQDIVGILESIGSSEQKRNAARIIFDRRDKEDTAAATNPADDDEDDFFD